MTPAQTLQLTDSLLDIQRTLQVLYPLIEDGKEEFEEFSDELKKILAHIFPTYTVAVVGPVGSGKSTLLSSLLKESGKSGRHPITSINPSNETFAPMTISYGEQTELMVYYFSRTVLHRIEGHLQFLEEKGDKPYLVAQYRDLRDRLRNVEAVLAGNEDQAVVQRHSLEGLSRPQLSKTLQKYIAQSSDNDDVYGIYKVELTYPGKITAQLKNFRFTDLYGFGEPSPLVNIKYSRFVSEEDIDVVIYVFPDRSVTEDFNKLFEIPGFIDEIVANDRLLLVLNKADAYTDRISWSQVEEQFRKTLIRHSPILRGYAKKIPIFVLSAASIDGKVPHLKGLKKPSLKSLHALRDTIQGMSNRLQRTSSDPSIYLVPLFDLLEGLDILADTIEDNLNKLNEQLPAITRLVDNISQRHSEFSGQAEHRVLTFQEQLKNELFRHLSNIPYEEHLDLDMVYAKLGNPKALLRAMTHCAQSTARSLYLRRIPTIFSEIGEFIDSHLLEAHREYVKLQDEAALSEVQELDDHLTTRFWKSGFTVHYSPQDFLSFSSNPNLHLGTQSMFNRFVDWYLWEKVRWDVNKNINRREARTQIVSHLELAVQTFMQVYILKDSKLSHAFIAHICIGGEKTFWDHFTSHIHKLDEVLNDRIRIAKWKLGLYQNKRFFVSNKPQYKATLNNLIQKKNDTENMIVRMV